MATLRELRQTRGIRPEKVAADLELSERTLRRIESGASAPRRIILVAFADYYGVDVDTIELVGDTEAA